MLTSFRDFGKSASLDDLYNIAAGVLTESIVYLTEEDKRIIAEIKEALFEAENTPHDVPEDEDSEEVSAQDPYKNAYRPAQNPAVTARPAAPTVAAKPAVVAAKPAQPAARPVVATKPVVAARPQAAVAQKPIPKGTKVIHTVPQQVVKPGGKPLSQQQLDDRGILAIKNRIAKSNQKWKDFTSNAKELLGRNSTPISPSIMNPGFCYFFKYRSKLYDRMEIDFYEQNPIIICVERKPKIILGLNFHYLSPAERKEMVRKLNIPTTITKNPSTKITNWSIAKSVLGEDRAKRMLKAYLPNRISECYALVPYHLHLFSQLDMSNFTSDVNRTYVWRDWKNLRRNKFNLNYPAASPTKSTPKATPKSTNAKPVISNKPVQPVKKTK
jgi:hypothetical protein